MTTDIVEIGLTDALLKNMHKNPDLAQYIEDNNGNVPSYFFEEELFTHDEFKERVVQRVNERLGFKIKL